MKFITFAKRDISERVACDLKELHLLSCGEHITGRFWREVLSDDERVALGGKFRQAYLDNQGMAGMYHRLHPALSRERALLESMRQVGWLIEAKFVRLVEAIGEQLRLPPSRGVLPVWDAENRTLFYRSQAVRRIKQLGKATRIVPILNAFEQQGWPSRVNRAAVGNLSSHDLRDALKTLNRGLSQLRFCMDGTGNGVIWQLA